MAPLGPAHSIMAPCIKARSVCGCSCGRPCLGPSSAAPLSCSPTSNAQGSRWQGRNHTVTANSLDHGPVSSVGGAGMMTMQTQTLGGLAGFQLISHDMHASRWRAAQLSDRRKGSTQTGGASLSQTAVFALAAETLHVLTGNTTSAGQGAPTSAREKALLCFT